MNIVATTYSALAAGLLRHQVASDRFLRAATPSASPVDPQRLEELERVLGPSAPRTQTYDARGRVAGEVSVNDLVAAAAELLTSQEQVQVSAAALRRAHQIQGSLLDVLA